jgi:hypothetical protein
MQWCVHAYNATSRRKLSTLPPLERDGGGPSSRKVSFCDSAAGIHQCGYFTPVGSGVAAHGVACKETFGDPALVGDMASHMIQGIQEVDAGHAAILSRAAACAKHFVGYSIRTTVTTAPQLDSDATFVSPLCRRGEPRSKQPNQQPSWKVTLKRTGFRM